MMKKLIWLAACVCLLLLGGCKQADVPPDVPPAEEPGVSDGAGITPDESVVPDEETSDEEEQEDIVLSPELAQYEPMQLTGVNAATELVLIGGFRRDGELAFHYLDGHLIHDDGSGISGDAVYVSRGVTMAPVARLCYQLGYDYWVEEGKDDFVLRSAGSLLVFQNGSAQMKWSGQEYQLAAPAVLDGSIVYLPLCNIPELFSLKMTYSYEETVANVGTLNIWLSDVDFIPDDELAAEAVSANFEYQRPATNEAVGYRIMKEDGQTSRGIAIGASLEDVTQAYGPPHHQSGPDDNISEVGYSTAALPGMDGGHWLTFDLKNNQVTGVRFDWQQ